MLYKFFFALSAFFARDKVSRKVRKVRKGNKMLYKFFFALSAFFARTFFISEKV